MKTKNEIFPIELTSILDSLSYEENGGLVITSLSYVGNDLLVNFKLSYGDEVKVEQLWKIEIIGIEEEKIIPNWTSYPEIYSDHFLLYDLTDNYIELYFNGKAKDSEKLFIELYQTHHNNFKNDIEFGYGINAPYGMLKLCSYENGLFARGSKKILEKYEKCLNTNGIKTNYLNEIESENRNLLLLIFGNSYFIGKEFKFSKVE